MDVEGYFDRRADVAEATSSAGHYLEACILASSALDPLDEIWFRDCPSDKTALDKRAGGRCPSSLRMAELVTRFSGDATAASIAVVLFAQDLKRHRPEYRQEADALLA